MVLFRFEIFLNGKRRVVDLPRAGKVTIGRSNSDLCLDDSTVSMDHATLLINVGTCLVADRASVNGTVINGTPISEGELRHGDLLQLGAARLKFIEVPELEGEEGAIVAGVVRGGDEARQVYADWLEARGRTDDAAWLRAEVLLHARSERSREPLRVALERLTPTVGATFRALVSRPRIEACGRPVCPKKWASLPAGNDERVRQCVACDGKVRFCDTVEEAQRRTAAGRPGATALVVDPSRPREAHDLWPLFLIG